MRVGAGAVPAFFEVFILDDGVQAGLFCFAGFGDTHLMHRPPFLFHLSAVGVEVAVGVQFFPAFFPFFFRGFEDPKPILGRQFAHDVAVFVYFVGRDRGRGGAGTRWRRDVDVLPFGVHVVDGGAGIA